MRFMLLMRTSRHTESSARRGAERLTAALADAGVLLAGERLHPSADGARVRLSGGTRTVVDGSFAETRDLVVGFWLIQATSVREAVEWVRRTPIPGVDAVIEIRGVVEPGAA